MRFRLRALLPLCMVLGCCFFPQKGFAFDFKKYEREQRQLRSLTPSNATSTSARTADPKKRSRAFALFADKLLEALQSDAVPTKIFDTGTNLSFYFKPAKVTKLGIQYKF